MIFTFSFLIIFTINGYGKYWRTDSCEVETASEINAEISVNVELKDGWYEYTYNVKNLSTSKWKISFLWLHTKDIYNRCDFTNLSYYSSPDEDLPIEPKNENLPDISTTGTKESKDIGSSIGWLFRDILKPGSDKVIFVKTKLLPTISDYYIRGPAYIRCEYGTAGGFYDGYDNETPYGPGVVGKTLVPGKFSDNKFAHIKKLKEELEKAVKIKWIKDKSSYEALIKVLDEFENLIKSGIGAREKAEGLVERVKVLRDKGLIKDEVYQMMKVHFLYLSKNK